MAKAYARNKTELRKELKGIGIVPKNIKKIKDVKGYKPWFSFDISNNKIRKKKWFPRTKENLNAIRERKEILIAVYLGKVLLQKN